MQVVTYIIISAIFFLGIYSRRFLYKFLCRNGRRKFFILYRIDILSLILVIVLFNPYLMIYIFEYAPINEILLALIYVIALIIVASLILSDVMEERRQMLR